VADQTIPASVRASLEHERERLAQQIESLDPAAGTAVDDNFADSGQVAAEMGENQALAAQLRTELEDVERALARLDDGTYGTCEECGQPIAAARLEAMPTARFCIDHA